ncbi:DUF1996 domain-containing protein [Streptomyces sp. NPDC005574]|uniref:DUF1996 domain-containing protein n=1 Tax=Streptomyces sp. NPDC005574 TaxID=3156891 RepID=UPI0033ACDB0A
MLGGGGLVAANVYASATEDSGPETSPVSAAATIDCPDVGERLTTVPDDAREEVDKELAVLDGQIAAAYQRLQDPARAGEKDRSDVDSGIMNPLKEDRAATIGRIASAIERVGERPQGIDDLASCTLREAQAQAQTGDGQDGGDQAGQDQGGQQAGDGGQDQGGQQAGNGGQAGNGPVAADYADITSVQPDAQAPSTQSDASTGTFTTRCGVNAGGLFNSDNVIVAPGVGNGAHHFHDYVGNQANNAFASDDDLAKGDTSCEDKGDRSTYYWPVLRLQNGTQEKDAGAPGGGTEGNAGEIVTPKDVTLTFVGSPRGKVTAMPRLLRIITGDAKAFVNGTANANASWSCTGFEDRQLKDKYPLCPQGSDVVRTFKFQSCWDGRNIDSANHRTHVAFAQADGACPAGFQAIPQLSQRIVYDVDAPSLQDGGKTTPLFAVDSFPEQLHKPVTDHGDFINVFDEDLMGKLVDCINQGRTCGAGADQEPGGNGNGDEPTATPTPPAGGDASADPGTPGDDATSQPPSATPTAGDNASGGSDGSGDGKGDGSGKGDDNGNGNGSGDGGGAGGSGGSGDSKGSGGSGTSGGDEPKTYATSASTHRAEPSPDATSAPSDNASGQGSDDVAGGAPSAAVTSSSEVGAQAAARTEPQANRGGLAETGAQLWPAAAGAVLLLCGFLLLRRTRRGGM